MNKKYTATADEIDILIDEYKTSRKPEKVKLKLFNAAENYIMWVVTFIHEQLPQYAVDIDDLISVARLAFLQAMLKYDPTKNMQFISYAVNYMRGRIGNFLQKEYNYHVVINPFVKVSYMNDERLKRIKAEISGEVLPEIIFGLSSQQISGLKISDIDKNKVKEIRDRQKYKYRSKKVPFHGYIYDNFRWYTVDELMSDKTVSGKQLYNNINNRIVANLIMNFIKHETTVPLKIVNAIKKTLLCGGSYKDFNNLINNRIKQKIRRFVASEQIAIA